MLFFLMILRATISTRTYTLFPYTTLFRSADAAVRLSHRCERRRSRHRQILPGPHRSQHRRQWRLARLLTNGTHGGQRFELSDEPAGRQRDQGFDRRPERSFSGRGPAERPQHRRSEENTSELQSLMRISYADFCLKKKNRSHAYNRDQHTKTS